MINSIVRPKDFLRKLEVFGKPITGLFGNKSVNFEYPTEAIFAQMSPNLTLTSIQFSTYHQSYSFISGIKLVYSDQTESPLFKKDGVELYHTQSINFNSNRKVARV